MKYFSTLVMVLCSALSFGIEYPAEEEPQLIDKGVDFLRESGLDVRLGGVVGEEILEVIFIPNKSYLESEYDLVVFLVDAKNNPGLLVTRFTHCEGCETRFYVEKGYGLVVVLDKYGKKGLVSYRVTIDNFDGRGNSQNGLSSRGSESARSSESGE